MLAAPAQPPAENHEYEQNSEDAPRASAAACKKTHKKGVNSEQNSEDAGCASAATAENHEYDQNSA